MNPLPDISTRAGLKLQVRCNEKLGGLPISSLPNFGNHLVKAFEKASTLCKGNPLYTEAYHGKVIACIATTESIYHGYAMAYMSGLAHRISPAHARWNAVHSPTIGCFEGGHANAIQEIPPLEALDMVEPQYLGVSTECLFNRDFPATYPDLSLFVYPENWVTDKYVREIVEKIVKDDRIKHAIIITKSSIVLTDFFAAAVTIIAPEKDDL